MENKSQELHGPSDLSDFAIGHPVIDNQHMALLELIVALRRLSQSEADTETVKVAVADLIDYVRVHFEAEESFMLASAQAEYDDHKREHEAMKEWVAEIVSRNVTDGAATCQGLADLLQSWFEEHVAKVDYRLKPYIALAGSG